MPDGSVATRELLRDAEARLAGGGVPSPAFDAAELLAHVLGTTRPQLGLVTEVAPEHVAAFDALVVRRAAREPLQHLIGTAWFRYVTVDVGPGVFVPRPETELLVGWAVDECRRRSSSERQEFRRSSSERQRAYRDQGLDLDTGAARLTRSTGDTGAARLTRSTVGPVVVDLCTGSGVIAKAIAQEVPMATVHAVELDPAAHEWATRNLEGSGVDLRRGDMAEAFHDLDGQVDVITCNPPYIPLEAWESVAPEAREHDPDLALFSGEDGLDAIRVLEAVAARLLRPGGVVGAEHADAQGESAPAVFSTSGRWREVRDHLDLAGRPRFLTARLAT